jgi:hypothetical protein
MSARRCRPLRPFPRSLNPWLVELRGQLRVPRGTKYRSQRVGGEPANEQEHFWQCPTCDAWVDMRDLGAMIQHGEPLPHPRGDKPN